MTPDELEEIIEKARIDQAYRLNLSGMQITHLPSSIGSLKRLTILDLDNNQLTSLPDSICSLSKLNILNLDDNQLIKLPDNIGNLSKLNTLYSRNNQFKSLPDSIINLHNLSALYLDGNSLNDLEVLQSLKHLTWLSFLDVNLSRKYWIKFQEWEPKWLLDELNVEIRSRLIQQVGYERICQELNAREISHWREYSLLKIDGVEPTYDDYQQNVIDREPMLLLKMTCPSTNHIHILRVPPEMTSAEEAITWVNHGIHPDGFAIQT